MSRSVLNIVDRYIWEYECGRSYRELRVEDLTCPVRVWSKLGAGLGRDLFRVDRPVMRQAQYVTRGDQNKLSYMPICQNRLWGRY